MYTKEIAIGHRFGSRTVTEVLPERKNGYIIYRVVCDCGDEMKLNGSYLRTKNRPCKSCSAKLNTPKGKAHYAFKHGMASRTKGRDRIYSVWVAMRQRCNDPANAQYKDYGGRGIAICQEWDDFSVFITDMGESPNGGQLERINNDLGYCKDNCRWATRKEQANNRRTTRIHEIDGKQVKNTDLLTVLGWSKDKLRYAETKYGYEFVKASYTIASGFL